MGIFVLFSIRNKNLPAAMKLFLLASVAHGFFLGAIPKPPNAQQQKINAIAADAMLQHVSTQARNAEVTDLEENVSPQGGKGIDQDPKILEVVAADFQSDGGDGERSSFGGLDLEEMSEKKKKKDAKKKKKDEKKKQKKDDKKNKKEGKKDKKDKKVKGNKKGDKKGDKGK